MEVIPLIRSSATGSEPPNADNGIKRHVQEWSRLDRLTGILEHARVEADQWTNHTANTKHKFGKVVDRRARNLADGTKEETQQTKQLEVFQAHSAGCSVQVIRSQTSTTSSWHNSSKSDSNAFQWSKSSIFDKKDDQFDQLRLEHSPLDVSSQKSKANVGRSGSISARRPPTRKPHAITAQLPKIDSLDSADTTADDCGDDDSTITTNLDRLKSCSNDAIRAGDQVPVANGTGLDRSSRFRRSLQFAQTKRGVAPDPGHQSVAGELETVLKKVLGNRSHGSDTGQAVAMDENPSLLIKPAATRKKPSFVTVESLQVTKNNLRRQLNGSDGNPDRDDDGIETDAKPVAEDSRSLDYRGSALVARSEEWYNRRKSYGFEKVTNGPDKYVTDLPTTATMTDPMDSSTDSGICRSTENGLSNSSRQSSVDRESIADLVKKYSNKEINNNINNSNNNNNNNNNSNNNSINNKNSNNNNINNSSSYNEHAQVHAYNTTVVAKGKILEAINSLRSKSSTYFDIVQPNDTVPSASKTKEERDKEQTYTRRLSVSIDMDKKFDKDEVPKRHSIAVVSEVADKEPSVDKKNANKKVEFCRTEVHFDATPGKINIVDMEDKPAPAQLYRPKKRYNRPPEKSHGLPEYRFGDDLHSEVVMQINGTGYECSAADEEAGDHKPKSILKPQQHQQQPQQQQQQNPDCPVGVASDNGIEVRISSTESTPVDCRRASWSVADRVKQVEAVGFSTRVNFTEGETTAVGFDPTDPKKHRYSYNGTASPVWYQNNGNSSATDDITSAAAECHEKLLVRIGATASGAKKSDPVTAADPCTFSKCFGGHVTSADHRLSSTSLVMNTARLGGGGADGGHTEQPRTYTEEMNSRMQGRFRKTPSTSWPRCGHKTYPVAAATARKYQLLKSCADIKRERVTTATAQMPDVIGALDDLSKTIDEQIVDHRHHQNHYHRQHQRHQDNHHQRPGAPADRHVTLIKVGRRSDDETVHGRLEYVTDLMSTDETSEESLKADEEVRSYMAADWTNEEEEEREESELNHDDLTMACDNNLEKIISAVNKNSDCSQDIHASISDVKSYESSLTVPKVTSVLLNHDKPSAEPSERSQFQPVSVHTTQVTHVVKQNEFEEVLAAKQISSKRVPVKIVQDNRKNKPKTELSKTEVPITKLCATVSLKQVPMTVQPKPAAYSEKKKTEKKESIYGNVGYRANSLRIKTDNKPAVTSATSSVASKTAVQDLFSTGRDSWLNMPKDLGPKMNRSKVQSTTYRSRVGRKETVATAVATATVVDTEVSVLEELNRAADEILKAVNGYTDDDSQHPNAGDDPKSKADSNSEAKLKNKKKAARLLQRANSREALLHLDEVSSSEDEAVDEVQRVKPKMQRRSKTQQTVNSVANKSTTSFTKKIQSRVQNVTKTNVQHKVHPTCYGNVSSCTQTASMKFRTKPSDSSVKRVVDQKDTTKGRYHCKITTRTFNSK